MPHQRNLAFPRFHKLAPHVSFPSFLSPKPVSTRASVWLSLVAIVVLLTGVPSSLVHAQGELVGEIEVDEEKDLFRAEAIIAGFDAGRSVRREQTWIPFTAILANDGPPLSGELEIRINDTNIRYHTPIDMPTGSRKVGRLSLFPVSDVDEFSVSFIHGGGFLPVKLSPQHAVKALDPLTGLVSVLSPLQRMHARLGLNVDDEGSGRQVLYSAPIMLPEHWLAYDGIDALVWDGHPGEEMTEAQLDALSTWVQMGGHLVLALGENWGEIGGTPWVRFLPFTFDASVTLPAGTKIQWPKAEAEVTLLRDSVAATSTGRLAQDAYVALRAEGPNGRIPLLIRRRVGAGVIDTICVTLAGKEPLIAPNAYEQSLLDSLLAPGGRLPLMAADRLDPNAAKFLRSQVQAELPSAWFIAGFLGLYILLVVPVNYVVFKRLGHLEWAWFMVPVWAIVFAVAAYYIGAVHQLGRVTLAEFSVVEAVPSSPSGRAHTLVSLYSPVRDWYHLTAQTPDDRDQVGFFSPQLKSDDSSRQRGRAAPQPSQISDELQVSYGEGTATMEDILVHHWAQKTLKVTHRVPLGEGIEIDLRTGTGDDALAGLVTNRTQYTLIDAQIVCGDKVYALGTLSPGAKASPKPGEALPAAPSDTMGGMGGYGGGMVMRPGQRPQPTRELTAKWRNDPSLWLQESVLPAYKVAMEEDDIGQGLNYLMAYVDEPVLHADVGREIGDHLGVVLVVVPFVMPSAMRGTGTLKADWRFVIEDGAAYSYNRGDPNFYFEPSSDVELTGNCLHALGNVRFDDARIRIGISEISNWDRNQARMGIMPPEILERRSTASAQSLRGVKIEMKNWKSQDWEAVNFQHRARPDGKERELVLRIPDPGYFVDRRDRTVHLRIKNNSQRMLCIPSGDMRVDAQVTHIPVLPVSNKDVRG